MSERLLSPQERQRFIRYCREESESYRMLLQQVEKLGPVVAETIGKQHRLFVLAYTVVANHLESVEDVSIAAGGDCE